MSIVEQVKNSNGNKDKLRLAYEQSANHLQRSLKAHLPELCKQLTENGDSLDVALFKWFYPERSINLNCACGEPLQFRGKVRGFGKYCSTSCAAKDPDLKQKRETSVMRKYGVKHISQVEDIKHARALTNISRYGNICSAQGIEQSAKRIPQLKSKAIETVLKAKATVLQRYGVECATKLPQVQAAARESQIKKYETQTLPNILNQLSLDGFKLIDRATWKWQHSCGNQFHAELNKANECPHCHVNARSRPEREMLDFIRALGVKAESGNRKILAPLEVDIFIPAKNIAFELNGVYWHRDDSSVTTLHKKTLLAESRSIKLVHFWDYEWIHKKSIVKSMIINALGKTENKLDARKLRLDLNVNQDEAIKFCNDNHISGFARGAKKIGLRNGDELVCLLIAGSPRFDKKYDLEIIRFCTKLNTQVRGGFGKLLKQLNGSIISYADKRFYAGDAYKALGFSFERLTPPNYSYIKGETVIPRYQAQKHKLKDLLDNFNEDLTEAQNMSHNNYIKHSDCGSAVFVLNK